MHYPDAANHDLLGRIPLTARTILDVGCGTAALGLEYKRRNPTVRYFGIESDPDSCVIAAGRIDFVAGADVEVLKLPFGDEMFDCIIYGDILEHLRDPWAVMREQATRLNPGGVMLICMPNIEHWSFAAKLMTGTWAYEQTGLMDHTHLRWFTSRSTHQAITQSGLHPHDVSARVFDAAACADFVERITPGLKAMGVDPVEYYGRASPLQHIWRATRAPVTRMNIVSTMLPPIGGVSDIRVIQPMRGLGSIPEVLSIVTQDAEIPQFEADAPKFFIFHRPLLAGAEGLVPVRQLLALGFLVICEFDDHPDFIPVLKRDDVQNFRAVHAVQTSTIPLAEVLVERNPEIAVFPNAIEQLSPPRNFSNPERMTLFFGGLNRENDWPEWLGALNDVIAVVGDRLHIHVVNDAGLYEGLQTEHKSFTPLCDYETYLDLLANSEISFMPLQDNVFNRCKSDLKFLEAAAARVVALASPTVYARVIEDGRTGMIFHSVDELKQKLLFLLHNHDAARAMADQARHYVAHHRMLASQLAGRLDWYRGLWERREQLNRDLLARVPELAMPVEPDARISKILTDALADIAGPEAMGRVVVVSRAAGTAQT